MGLKAQRNKLIKSKFKTLREGGDMVSDQEKASMEGDLVSGVEQTQQAQQAQLGRAAQGQATGAPLTGQLRAASSAVAEQGAKATTAARGEANKLTAALREQREAQVMGETNDLLERRRQAGIQTVGMIGGVVAGLVDAVMPG